MANMAAVIANRGSFYIPHVVKKIGDYGAPSPLYTQKYITGISPENFEPVIEGWRGLLTAALALRPAVPVLTVSLSAARPNGTNPHGKDHSIFVAFAPKDNPQIAIAVYVENAGFGSQHSPPRCQSADREIPYR